MLLLHRSRTGATPRALPAAWLLGAIAALGVAAVGVPLWLPLAILALLLATGGGAVLLRRPIARMFEARRGPLTPERVARMGDEEGVRLAISDRWHDVRRHPDQVAELAQAEFHSHLERACKRQQIDPAPLQAAFVEAFRRGYDTTFTQ